MMMVNIDDEFDDNHERLRVLGSDGSSPKFGFSGGIVEYDLQRRWSSCATLSIHCRCTVDITLSRV
jgi:hypothetical protein